MAFTITSDEKGKWYYAPEATFGTAIAMSATSWKEVKFAKTEYPAMGVQVDNLDNNRASRVYTLADRYVDNFSGPAEVSFSMPMTIDRVSDFLYGVTQYRVSQGAGSAYQKVFKAHASQPDFTANAGYFFSLLWVPQEFTTTRCVRYTSCILRNLNITLGKGKGQANIARMSGTILAKKVEIDQNFSGSGTAQGTTWIRALDFTPTLTLVASGGDVEFAPNWREFTLSIDNGAVGVDLDSSGNPVTYYLNPGMGLKATLGIWLDTNSYEALYSRRNGSAITLILSKGSDGVTGYHRMAVKGYLASDPLTSGDGQQHVNIDLQLGDLTAAAADALVYTIADGISQ